LVFMTNIKAFFRTKRENEENKAFFFYSFLENYE
jgi:hypothetical protein